MSKEIDERIVKAEFDNRNFDSRVEKTIKVLDEFTSKLDFSKAAENVNNILSVVPNSVGTAVGEFSKLSNVIGNIGRTTMKVTIINKLTNAVLHLGATCANTASQFRGMTTGFNEYELKMDSVQTTMANTGASLAKVNKTLNQMNKFADDTIYSFSDMTRNLATFTAQGVKLEQSKNAIEGIAKLAAISGANSEQASRAMYNFSQALSMGYMQLVDWKTMENTGMGNKRFRKEVIETAKELGYASRTFRTGNNQTKKGSDILKEAETNFRNTLNYQWLDTKLMLAVLGKYNDETTDIGKAASAAAKDVKTFSKLLDTLGEAIQSGWAQSWEIVIGDFNEAKKLWTSVSNSLSGIFNNIADNRNKLLQGWKDLGGRESILRSFANIFELLRKRIEPVVNGFHNIFPKWTANSLVDATKKFEKLTKSILPTAAQTRRLTNIFSGLFSILRAGKTIIRTTIKSFSPLIEAITGSSGSLLSFVNRITDFIWELSDSIEKGNEFTRVITNIGNSISKIILIMRDSIIKVFGGTTLKILDDFTKRFSHISDAFILSETTAKRLSRIFNGLFSGISILGKIIKTVLGVAFELLAPFFGTTFKMGVDSILEFIAKIGDAITKLNKNDKGLNKFLTVTIKIARILGKVLSTIGNVLVKIGNFIINSGIPKAIYYLAKIISELVKSFMNLPIVKKMVKFISDAFNLLGDALEDLYNRATKRSGGTGKFDIQLFLESLTKTLARYGSIISSAIKYIASAIKTGFKFVERALGTLFVIFENFRKQIVKFLSNAKISDVTNVIVELLNLKLLWSISSLLGNAGKAMDKLTKPLKNLMEQTSKTLGTFRGYLRAKTVILFSLTLLALASSILILSKIPIDTLLSTVGIIAVLSGILIGLIVAVDKNKKATMSLSKALSSAALAIASFVLAVKLLNNVLKDLTSYFDEFDGNKNKLGKFVAAMTLVVGEIAAMVFVIAQAGKLGTKAGAKSMIGLLSVSVLLLTMNHVIKSMAKLSINDIAKSSLALGGMMTLILGLITGLALIDRKILNVKGIGKTEGALKSIGSMLRSISVLLAISAIVVEALGRTDKDVLTKGVTYLGVMFGEIGLLSIMVASAVKNMNGTELKQVSKMFNNIKFILLELTAIAYLLTSTYTTGSEKAFYGFASLVASLALVIYELGKMPGGGSFKIDSAMVENLIVVGAIAGLLATMASGISKLVSDGDISKFITTMAGMAIMLPSLSTAVILLSKMGPGVNKIDTQMLANIGAIVGALGALALAVAGAANLSGDANWLQILAIFAGLNIILPAFTACVLLISKVPVTASSIASAVNVIAFAGSISMIALSLAELASSASPGELAEATQCLTQILIAMGILMTIMTVIGSIGPVALAAAIGGGIFDIFALGMLAVGKAAKLAAQALQIFIETIKGTIDYLSDPGLVDKITQIADNLVQGFVVALLKFSPTNIITQVGQGILDSFKNVLGIHSPSKKTEEMGNMLMQGLTNGMSNNSEDAENEANEAGSKILEQLRESLKDDANLNLSPSITPVLDLSNIKNGSKDLSSLFEADADLNLNRAMSDDDANKSKSKDNEDKNSSIDSVLKKLSAIKSLVSELKDMDIKLDSGELVGGLAPKMDRALGARAKMKRRGV